MSYFTFFVKHLLSEMEPVSWQLEEQEELRIKGGWRVGTTGQESRLWNVHIWSPSLFSFFFFSVCFNLSVNHMKFRTETSIFRIWNLFMFIHTQTEAAKATGCHKKHKCLIESEKAVTQIHFNKMLSWVPAHHLAFPPAPQFYCIALFPPQVLVIKTIL